MRHVKLNGRKQKPRTGVIFQDLIPPRPPEALLSEPFSRFKKLGHMLGLSHVTS